MAQIVDDKKPIVYFCDPEKNPECSKESCYMDPCSTGECRFSFNEKHSRDGIKYTYNEYFHVHEVYKEDN